MNSIKHLFFIAIAPAFLPIFLYGQDTIHELILPDYFESGKYLNELILSDTSLGTRKDLERVYVLKRNGVYYLSASLQNAGWPLRMKAAPGAGFKPVVYCSPKTTSVPKPMFDARGDIWMKQLALVGIPEYDPTKFSMMTNNIINVNVTGITITIDSCILSTTTNAHLQTTKAAKVIKVSNTIFTNGGSIQLNNFGNGRGIDLREMPCDSLFIKNCTFINMQDRAVRHYDATSSAASSIKYFMFDHNTFANSMGCHGNIFLSTIGSTSVITNNLFVNSMVLGDDTDVVRQAVYFESHGELNEFGRPSFLMIYSLPNDTTLWIVKNNYMAISPALQTWYDSVQSCNPGFTGAPDPLSHHIIKRLGSDSVNAFIKLSIDEDFFLKNTKSPIAMATWYRTPPPSGPGKQKNPTGFSSATDFDRRTWRYFSDTLDLSYSKSSQAYTGAENGLPVGDLNWWHLSSATEVEKIQIQHRPEIFHLNQNYPNPFNPSTVISYQLPGISFVKLSVYDILGREVYDLVKEVKPAGTYSSTWDAKGLSSGIYFCKMLAGSFVAVKKMILVR